MDFHWCIHVLVQFPHSFVWIIIIFDNSVEDTDLLPECYIFTLIMEVISFNYF